MHFEEISEAVQWQRQMAKQSKHGVYHGTWTVIVATAVVVVAAAAAAVVVIVLFVDNKDVLKCYSCCYRILSLLLPKTECTYR